MPEVNGFMGNHGLFVTRVACPYCKTEQKVHLRTGYEPQLMLCNQEDVKGCDRHFVIKVRDHKVVIEYGLILNADGLYAG